MVDEDHELARIWSVTVASGEVSALVTGDFHASDPQWSPDGRQLAYVTTPTPKADDGGLSDVWVLDVASKAARKLVENDGPDAAPRWSPGGTEIALLSRDAEKGLLGQPRLVVTGVEGGATPREVAPGFLYQPSAPTWSADGRTIYFEAQTRTVDRLYAVPAAGGTPKAITDMTGTFAGSSIAPGGAIAVVATSLDKPTEIYASVSAAPVALEKLSDHNPQVTGLALGRSEVITWKSKDGREVEGLLVYPVGYREGEKYPLIVNVHGGPSGIWANAFPASWGNYAHVWAGRGWAVLLPNPRGSSGYGEPFLLSNVRDWGGGDYQDVQTGVDHLIAKGVADPERLGQTGWSYGGYLTAWTLTQTDRFKAVMVGAGLTNMFSMYSTNDLQRILEGYFGAEPWDDTEIYYTRSAMNFIKQAKTPTLIMHGAADLRVPLGQAQELYMGLKKNEVPVSMAVYPREPHGLQEPRHQLDKMTRELEWFTGHVIRKGGS
jgi:dipeptidyl aminopeptidase/acylaminoacyl peptidase